MTIDDASRGVPPDIDARELHPPPRWMLLGEGRVLFERLRLLASLPRLHAAAPRGSGEPVLVVPGFATDDGWTAPLRGFLTSIGSPAQSSPVALRSSGPLLPLNMLRMILCSGS